MENKTIRPVASILTSIQSFCLNANCALFEFLFGVTGIKLYKDFRTTFGSDSMKLWDKLNYSQRVRMANYIESVTPVFDIEKNIDKKDIEILLKTDNNELQAAVRNLNVEKYLGNLDENAVLIYISKNKKNAAN